MKFNTLFAKAAPLLVLGLTQPAWALNYFELEVYPYQTASQHEIELENATSVSQVTDGVSAIRSSFEFNYGLTDRTEIAAYLDFMGGTGINAQFAGARVHARTRLFEKGELPVDFGIYGELEFPRNDTAVVEAELRGIIEKDFDRLTVALNPMVGKALKTREIAGAEHEEEEFEFGYATSVSYRMDSTFRPHLDLFGDVSEEGKMLLMPALDVKFGHGISASAHVGFGLNAETEKRMAGIRFEYEF